MPHDPNALAGPLLNAAVAKALGEKVERMSPFSDHQPWWSTESGRKVPEYALDWSIGGPLMEQIGAELNRAKSPDGWHGDGRIWAATVTLDGGAQGIATGSTMLVAAMRAFVASHFPSGIELP